MKDFNGHGNNKAGDVAYWNGSRVVTIDVEKYTEAFGPAVGVVVVPKGFAPDGKIRIVSLYAVNSNGIPSNTRQNTTWGIYGEKVSLTNLTKVPTTDNIGSTSTGSNGSGHLPSDVFNGQSSYVDNKSFYYSEADTTILIPSPYLGEDPNPEYYKNIEGNNALSDFNGLNNTKTLVNMGPDYVAANACWKYTDYYSNLQWYLPGMGELGYLLVRVNEINNSINKLKGYQVDNANPYWSSTNNSDYSAYIAAISNGAVYANSKNSNRSSRPFAIID